MKRLALIALGASVVMGFNLIAQNTWTPITDVLSIQYQTTVDAEYWVRYDTYYDNADVTIWDVVAGINIWAGLVQNT